MSDEAQGERGRSLKGWRYFIDNQILCFPVINDVFEMTRPSLGTESYLTTYTEWHKIPHSLFIDQLFVLHRESP